MCLIKVPRRHLGGDVCWQELDVLSLESGEELPVRKMYLGSLAL